jgi:regulator of replication initiation timing
MLYVSIPEDNTERHHQIPSITRIFKDGLHCNIWLGEEAGNGASVMDLVKKLSTELNVA